MRLPILPISIQIRHIIFPFFYRREAEAQRGKATCSRAHSQPSAELDSNPSLSDSKVSVLSSHDIQWVIRGNMDIPAHF